MTSISTSFATNLFRSSARLNMSTASNLVETAQSYLPESLGGKSATITSSSASIVDPGVKEGGMDINPDSSRHPELHKKGNEEAMQRERDQLKEKMKQPLGDHSSTDHTHKDINDSVPVSSGGANDGKPIDSASASNSEGGKDLRQGVHALETGHADTQNPGSAPIGGDRADDSNDVRKGVYSKSDGTA